MDVWGALCNQTLLQSLGILLEMVRDIILEVYYVEGGKDIVGQWVTFVFLERGTRPELRGHESTVGLLQTGDELALLLFQHLNIALGIHLVMRLFPFAKDTDGIINPASRARTRAIAFGLLQTTTITCFADPLTKGIAVMRSI